MFLLTFEGLLKLELENWTAFQLPRKSECLIFERALTTNAILEITKPEIITKLLMKRPYRATMIAHMTKNDVFNKILTLESTLSQA